MKQSFSLPLICMVFMLALVVGYILPVKVMQIGLFTLPGGAFIFPLTYACSACVTEVFGFATARKMIWFGTVGMALMGFFIWLTQIAPPAPFYHDQAAFNDIFGKLPRIILSLGGSYLIGEFISSAIISRSKIALKGDLSAARIFAGPIVAQLVVFSVFIPLTYAPVATRDQIIHLLLTRLAWAVLYHACVLGAILQVVAYLKRVEQVDALDVGVSLNPFRL